MWIIITFFSALTFVGSGTSSKDFPKLAGGLLAAPKLDDQVKEHLKRKGKEPHFGSEKSLYKLQEHVWMWQGP